MTGLVRYLAEAFVILLRKWDKEQHEYLIQRERRKIKEWREKYEDDAVSATRDEWT